MLFTTQNFLALWNGMMEYGNTAFRFIQIDSLETNKVLVFLNILAVALYRDLEWTENFESSDIRLNNILKTGAYTVLLNMQKYIYDGAKRDRLPCMGDLNPEQRTILAIFSDTSLIRWTLDSLKGQTPLLGPDCAECKAAAAIVTLSGLANCSKILLRNSFQGLSTFYGCYMLDAMPTLNALEIIRRYWGGMLDYGATTFCEDFYLDWLKNTSPISKFPIRGKNDLHADFGTCNKGLRHSLCHGWVSGSTSFLSRRIGGIRFLEPGDGTISISPDLCDLEYAAVCYPTPHGPIAVIVERGKSLKSRLPRKCRSLRNRIKPEKWNFYSQPFQV